MWWRCVAEEEGDVWWRCVVKMRGRGGAGDVAAFKGMQFMKLHLQMSFIVSRHAKIRVCSQDENGEWPRAV